MSQTANPSHETVRPFSVLGGILSYLIPGLGQICQGRVGKGFLFMVCLLGLFHVGQSMGNWQNVYLPNEANVDPIRNIINHRWHFAGQVWIGIAAWPAVWQYYRGPIPDDREVEPFPKEGTIKFWNEYQRPPKEARVNEFLVNRDKTPDLGWIYTVIAGMLNILVIYDACAGPAYGPAMPRADKPKPPAGEAPLS